jgi:hypothetical protein
MRLELNIRYLPLPVRCAIEWLGNVPQGERSKQRLASLLDHYLTVYGLAADESRTFYLESAAAIVQRRYGIEDAEFAAEGSAA